MQRMHGFAQRMHHLRSLYSEAFRGMVSGGPMWYMDSPLVRAAAVYSSRLLTCAAPVERTSSVLASHLRRGGSARLQKWAWSMGGRKIHAAASGGEYTPFDGLDRGPA